MSEDVSAPGWDAIDHALAGLYPQQQPRHYGTLISYRLGGSDLLQGISAYWREQPLPHWHFVTYGFSELYAKESEDPDHSGWGFELTFRLAAEPSDEPPVWVMNMLQNLARYVFDSGNPFAAGHYINANGPIALDTDTQLRALAFMHDPELAPMRTPNGQVEFLQVVGLTDDEEFALKCWSTHDVLEVFGPQMPLWITQLQRTSLMDRADVADAVRTGAARDGSRTGQLFFDGLSWSSEKHMSRAPDFQIVIGARQVSELLALLPARLPFGRELWLVGSDVTVVLAEASSNRLHEADGVLRWELTHDAMHGLCATLRPERGEYPLIAFPQLRLTVSPTEIRDSQGTVIQVIG